MTGLHLGLRSTRNRTATHRFATCASLHASESERRRVQERQMALLSHQLAETVSAAAPGRAPWWRRRFRETSSASDGECGDGQSPRPTAPCDGNCRADSPMASIVSTLRSFSELWMVRLALPLCGAISIVVFLGSPVQAQYPPPGYRPPPPGYYPPPCQAVTSGPFRGAARGAAGGALFGAIGGNAGKGAAIGAAVGGVAGAVRRGSARASGACY